MTAFQDNSVWSYPAYGQQDWRYAVQPATQAAPPVVEPTPPKKKRGRKVVLWIIAVLYALFTAINIQFMTDDYPECRNPGAVMPSGQQPPVSS